MKRKLISCSLLWSLFAFGPTTRSLCSAGEADAQSVPHGLIQRLPPTDLTAVPSVTIRQPPSAIGGTGILGRPIESAETTPKLSPPKVSASTERRARPSRRTLRIPKAIALRAEKLVAGGVALAERRAYYSSRDEFIGALRIVAQSLDEQSKSSRHVESLSLGLKAVKEAADLVPRRGRLDTDVALDVAVAAHRTPVLKGRSLDKVSSLTALQAYYDFAHQRLAESCGSEPAASKALLGLGKLYMAQALPDGSADDATAMLMFNAALDVAPNNADAANELGVLYARYGQMQEARDALLQSVRARPTSAAWRNLAKVHEHLGEVELARLANSEHDLVLAQGPPQTTLDTPRVSWVSPEMFMGRPEQRKESAHRPGVQPNRAVRSRMRLR